MRPATGVHTTHGNSRSATNMTIATAAMPNAPDSARQNIGAGGGPSRERTRGFWSPMAGDRRMTDSST